ncbi:Transcription factor GAGA [Dufourea novaeangliae]|uniref:Transcription factor GAGA n=1 Tax=Dufourea novaeangliae TaxID=178035 RepID=A0A154NX74_DUFNO|nr:Transcription factor GAGA [Dufourea novaeangliae]
MGSSGQLYSLSWGEFNSSLASAVQVLRGHGDLVDVTLAAGGRSFPAHKIVLCAASPFLLDLLKSTPCQHPVVMLAGIGADDLESLLEFVYRGEVSVEPSQLPSLLQAAHCLCIHGLTPPTILTENGEEVPASAIPTTNEALSKETSPYFPLKRRKKRRKSSSSSGKWPRTGNNADNENKPTDDHKDEENAEHGDDAGDGLSKVRSMSDQPAPCPLCGAILRQSRNLRRHLELLHFGFGGNNKSGGPMRHRRTDRTNDLVRSTLAFICPPHMTRMDHSRPENTDLSTSLSIASTVGSSVAGSLMGPSSNMLSAVDQSANPALVPASSSWATSMASANSGIYSSDGSVSMLNCLSSSSSSLPSLSSPHDVYRYGEMLRAGIAYHESSRQHTKDTQETDVT